MQVTLTTLVAKDFWIKVQFEPERFRIGMKATF